MAEYKVVYKDDVENGSILWEPGCPLFTSAVQIARDTKTAACFLQLKFKNISNEVIVGFEGNAVVTYADKTREELTLKYLDADIAPRAFFRPEALPLKDSEPVNVEIMISDVVQSKSAWSSTGKPEPLPHHEPLHLSTVNQAERDAELVELGKKPESFSGAIEDHGAWWLCSCGAINVGDGKCFRCQLSKEQILQLQNEAYLNEASKMRMEKATKRKKRIKLIAIIAAVVITLILAGLAVNSFVVQPMLEAQEQEQQRIRQEQEKQEEEARIEAEKEAEEQRRQEFLNQQRSCFAASSVSVDQWSDNLLSIIYTLDEKGNVTAAKRTLSDGTTNTVTIQYNDLGFPTEVQDEAGNTLSKFSVKQETDMGLPREVTQTSDSAPTCTYSYSYSNNEITFVRQTIPDLDGTSFDLKKGDKWETSEGLSARSTPESIIQQSYLSFFNLSASITIGDKETENGRIVFCEYGLIDMHFTYEDIENASVWAATISNLPADQMTLPYNIWLGL